MSGREFFGIIFVLSLFVLNFFAGRELVRSTFSWKIKIGGLFGYYVLLVLFDLWSGLFGLYLTFVAGYGIGFWSIISSQARRPLFFGETQKPSVKKPKPRASRRTINRLHKSAQEKIRRHEAEAMARIKRAEEELAQSRKKAADDLAKKVAKARAEADRLKKERAEFEKQKKPGPHEILGVSRSATKEQIKSAYRKLAAKFHPDKAAGATEEIKRLAAEKFKLITAAYNQLT